MRVFISWSKPQSRAIARALRAWLPNLFDSIEFFMSDQDIEAGHRWGVDIAENLNSCKLGILCVTPGNREEPWLLFEAGALANQVGGDKSKVIPYLFDLEPANLLGSPLADFTAVRADPSDPSGTLSLVSSLDLESGGNRTAQRLARFEKFWPDLATKLQRDNLPPGDAQPAPPDRDAILQQLLQTVQATREDVARLEARELAPRTLQAVVAQRLAGRGVTERVVYANGTRRGVGAQGVRRQLGPTGATGPGSEDGNE